MKTTIIVIFICLVMSILDGVCAIYGILHHIPVVAITNSFGYLIFFCCGIEAAISIRNKL